MNMMIQMHVSIKRTGLARAASGHHTPNNVAGTALASWQVQNTIASYCPLKLKIFFTSHCKAFSPYYVLILLITWTQL
jgi:hypothetical protein